MHETKLGGLSVREEDSELLLLLLWHQCDHKQIKTNFKTKTRQSRANENKDAHVNMFMLWRPSAPTETRLVTTQPSSNYESTRLPFHLCPSPFPLTRYFTSASDGTTFDAMRAGCHYHRNRSAKAACNLPSPLQSLWMWSWMPRT